MLLYTGGVLLYYLIPLSSTVYCILLGYITNEKFDTPEKKAREFDASLPDVHYEMKHKQELLMHVDNVISLRVDEVSPQIRYDNYSDVVVDEGIDDDDDDIDDRHTIVH